MPNTNRNTSGPRLRKFALSAAAGAIFTVAGLALSPSSPAYATTGTNGYMVSFGDSVPSGSHCHCTPYPVQYAHKVGAHVGRPVSMTNYAFGGAVTSDVMKQLGTAQVQKTVRQSGTALIMIGANNFERSFQDVLAHRRRASVVFPRVASYVQRSVTAEIQKIKQLHPGIHVIVAGYWNVMKDGDVGLRTYGAWGEAKADEATLDADAGLHNAAVATHATYVSTYYPFKGYNGKRNPTWLLAPDGDHPNATGHAVIARAFYRAAPLG